MVSCSARDPVRPPGCIRTTAAASCARSSSGRRAVARARRTRLWSAETRLPTFVVGLDVPRESSAARIEARTRGDVRAGSGGGGACGAATSHAQVLGLDAVRELPRPEAIAELERAHAALRRLPAQVDAAHPGHRYDRRRPAGGRGGGCDSRSGTRSVTATCSSSGASRCAARLRDRAPALRRPLRGRLRRRPRGASRRRARQAEIVIWNPDGSRGGVLRQRQPDRRRVARPARRRRSGDDRGLAGARIRGHAR